MSVYDSCSTCNGRGGFDCTNCLCSRCGGRGVLLVECTRCESGNIVCARCEGRGDVVVKKGLFSDKYGTCPTCNGMRRIKCGTCKGSAQVESTCSACQGRKRNSSCTTCNGTGRTNCQTCSGSGRVPSAWSRSLSELPVERLRFEYEKRQRKLTTLQVKISGLNSEYERAVAAQEEEYQRHVRNRSLSSYDPPGTVDYLIRELMGAEGEVGSLEAELSMIDRALNGK
jgi:hypothetical protein